MKYLTDAELRRGRRQTIACLWFVRATWCVMALLCIAPAFAQSSWCSGANCSNGGVPVRNSVFTQELADQCADIQRFNCRTLVAPPAFTEEFNIVDVPADTPKPRRRFRRLQGR